MPNFQIGQIVQFKPGMQTPYDHWRMRIEGIGDRGTLMVHLLGASKSLPLKPVHQMDVELSHGNHDIQSLISHNLTALAHPNHLTPAQWADLASAFNQLGTIAIHLSYGHTTAAQTALLTLQNSLNANTPNVKD